MRQSEQDLITILSKYIYSSLKYMKMKFQKLTMITLQRVSKVFLINKLLLL